MIQRAAVVFILSLPLHHPLPIVTICNELFISSPFPTAFHLRELSPMFTSDTILIKITLHSRRNY